MGVSEHIRHHNNETYGGEDFDPEEHGLAIHEAIERLWQEDPEWRERFSASQQKKMLDYWHDEKYAEQRVKHIEKYYESWTEERRAKRSAEMGEFYRNPLNRQRVSERSKVAWTLDDGTRREQQREIARKIRIREEITAEIVRAALDETGSIRGAARLLNCDRAVFRRFPDVLHAFKGTLNRNNHKVASVRELHGDHAVYCLTVPEAGNFGLEAGVFVLNCGIITNITPFEPMWEGYVTLEISNTTPLPAKVYANEGIAQVLFFEADEECEVSYADKKGKYQGQTGVTPPKL
jgi:dCTP deaminase